MELRETANLIIKEAINSALPNEAVKRALKEKVFPGKVILVSIGKAGWQMAKAASDILGTTLTKGIVITKYEHVMGDIPNVECLEAGHPKPDKNSYLATQKALDLVHDLTKDDAVVFLISGGGSALFEKPLVSEEEMTDITNQLLACGADITEMNTIRKRLSSVKGGRFGVACAPAHVFSVVLSDVIGDPLDMIASGPAYPDASSTEQALHIIDKYGIKLSKEAMACMEKPLPSKEDLLHIETKVTGSVKQLCESAKKTCERLGITPVILTDHLCSEARVAGKELAGLAGWNADQAPIAFIEGGETIVRLTGKGKGGRNQELALSAAEVISGLKQTAVFSVGSDGTDGPTDAAGGYVDGETYAKLLKAGIDPNDMLMNNDAYHALKNVDGLIMTGPTGTNVNDFSVLLML